MLYGKNGVGKTRLLNAIGPLLRGGRRSFQSDEVAEGGTRNVSAPMAFYGRGGVHVHAPMTREDLAGQTSSAVRGALGAAVAEWMNSDPWTDTSEPAYDYEFEELYPAISTPSLVARLELDEQALAWFLEQGRWFFQPRTEQLFLCDPDPLASPLKERWLAEAAQRQAKLAERSVGDETIRFGQLYQSEDPVDRAVGSAWRYPGLKLHGHFLNSGGSLLMPLPETLDLGTAPPWVAYPILSLPFSVSWRALVLEEGRFTSAALRQRVSGWDPITDLTSRWCGQRSDDERAEVVLHANNLLADLFTDPPVLRLSVRPESYWYRGLPPIEWEVNTAIGGPWLPLDGLGAAHSRFVAFAIERAIEDDLDRRRPAKATSVDVLGMSFPVVDEVVDGGSFTLIDEPERAVHASAERHLAGAIRSLADFVVVSTHSTEFLDVASQSNGSVIRVARRVDGALDAREAMFDLDPSQRQAIADEWGLSPARLTAMTGVFVLVEGAHDQEMIGTLLAKELRQQRAVVMPLHGTKDLHRLATSEFLFSSTDAPIVVCLDNADFVALSRCKDDLATRRNTEAKAGCLSWWRGQPEFKTPEMEQLVLLMQSAVTTRQEHRLQLFGFSKRDIVEYLPANKIHPNYSTWDELDRAFLRMTNRDDFGRGDGKAKKNWVNRTGGHYDVPGIKRALKELAAANGGTAPRHQDFDDLARLLDRVFSSASIRSEGGH